MSWQDYITNYLVNNTDPNNGKTAFGVCAAGAIISNADGTIWACTPGFALKNDYVEIEKEDGSGKEKIQLNEFAHLLEAFNNKGECKSKGGLWINGEKHYAVSYDGDLGILYLKKSGGGAAIARSNLGFVIGSFETSNKLKNYNGAEEPQNPGMTNRAVQELQAFLLANNL
jgi:hypothetical protein